MASVITARYPFSGKNQAAIVAEEITVTTAVTDYGKNRVETVSGTTPNGSVTWKNLGYITGGSTNETRTMEEITTIARRNVQQLIETRFECSGVLNIDFQNARPIYFTIAANNGLGTPAQTAPGITHTDNVGSVTGLCRHIIYEPELVSGSYTDNAVSDIASFNLIDNYTVAGPGQPKDSRKYLGCKVDSASFNFTRDGSVKVDINWKGSQVAAAQATTVANLGVGDFLGYEEVFPPVFGAIYMTPWAYPSSTPTWASASETSLVTAANRVGDLTTLTLNISNNLEPLFVIGDVVARNLIPQQRKYEGRMSMAFVNEADHLRFLGEFNNTYAADPNASAGRGTGTVAGSVITDGAQTWGTNALAGGTITINGTDFPIVSNTGTTITVTGSPTTGSQSYAIKNVGIGSWGIPWYGADRQKYYAMKVFYDNSSLGYTTASANYRRIEVTLLGVKFKSISTPKQVAGIIYQDYDFQALMLAPYNSSDNVGGFVIYDDITSTNFHSTATGIA